MKTKKIVLAMLAALTLMSFSSSRAHKKIPLMMGTYSTCGNDIYGKDQLKFGLTINEDFTFHYFDNSNEGKKIDARGNWTLNKNTIILKNYSPDPAIENKWTIDKNGKCLKSKKGLSFTRLCNIKECK